MTEPLSMLADAQDSCLAPASSLGNVLSFPLGQTRSTRRALSRHEVFGYVFEALLDQRLLPGDGLSLRWLSEQYGAGRRVAEQVLNQLAKAGLTVRKPGCTAQVCELDRQHLQAVLHARQVVEQSAVALLCQPDADFDATQLNALIAREKHHIETRQPAKALHCATQFHLALVAETGNGLLLQFAESLIARSYVGWVRHSTASSHEHRQQLMTALKNRDTTNARHCIQLSTTLPDNNSPL